jgi:hypothetical protein
VIISPESLHALNFMPSMNAKIANYWLTKMYAKSAIEKLCLKARREVTVQCTVHEKSMGYND